MDIVFDIQIENGSRIRAVGDETADLKIGDLCIFKKEYCTDYGRIIAIPGELSKHPVEPVGTKHAEIPHLIRKASEQDEAKIRENVPRCASAMKVTLQHVEQLNLPMKLINAHYALDGKLVTIQFSAEGRVDFRELVKQLTAALNTRIELRQIGVRDETSAIGGISPCGRPLCCCSFLRDFASINVKMAKEQDLVLTPTSISGVCGRLKCCLKYEHEGYLELEKTMPRRGEYCECREGRGKVSDRNLLTQVVTIQLDETGRTVTVPAAETSPAPMEKRKPAPKAEGQTGEEKKNRRFSAPDPKRKPVKKSSFTKPEEGPGDPA